ILAHSPATHARTLEGTRPRASRPVSPTGPTPLPGLTTTLTATRQAPRRTIASSGDVPRVTLVLPQKLVAGLRKLRDAATRLQLPAPPDPVPVVTAPDDDDISVDLALPAPDVPAADYFRRAGISVDQARLVEDYAAARQALENAIFTVEELVTRTSEAEGRV